MNTRRWRTSVLRTVMGLRKPQKYSISGHKQNGTLLPLVNTGDAVGDSQEEKM